MLQYNPSISGSLSVTGSLIVTNGVIGTVNGVDIQIFSSSISQVVTNIQTATGSQDGRLTSIESFTSSTSARLGSIETITASNIARINSLETTSASVDILNTTQNSRLSALETTSASVDSLNTTQNTRLTNLEEKTGSLATTGSNFFSGSQTITGSLYISADLIVQGSSSLQNITASAVSIGTNIVYLNTDTPAVRFAGLTVQDSGSSAGVTGSMLWDSLCNRWIYSNPSTIGYSGGMLLSGPRTQTLGTEPTLTCNYIAKSGGGDHLYDSCIIDDGTTVCVNATLKASGQVCGVMANFSCIGTNTSTPGYTLDIQSANGYAANFQQTTPSTYGAIRITGNGRGGELDFYSGSTMLGSIWADSSISGNIHIGTGTSATERMFICGNNGYVGIGTSTPTAILHVSGTPGQNNPSIRLTDCSATGNGGNVFISADKQGVGYNN
jgi:hypothetical protein